MEIKSIIGNVVVAVATAGVLGLAAYLNGMFQKGVAAGDVEQIRTVIQEELTTDAGKTYGEFVTEMSLGVNTLNTKVDMLTTDVNDLEQNILDLASD
jgi:outer membrane murein-binding lipoprotein Lpp